MRQEEILYMFPQAMRGKWAQAAAQADSLQEIRMRVNAPATVLIGNREWFVDGAGRLLGRGSLQRGRTGGGLKTSVSVFGLCVCG